MKYLQNTFTRLDSGSIRAGINSILARDRLNRAHVFADILLAAVQLSCDLLLRQPLYAVPENAPRRAVKRAQHRAFSVASGHGRKQGISAAEG